MLMENHADLNKGLLSQKQIIGGCLSINRGGAGEAGERARKATASELGGGKSAPKWGRREWGVCLWVFILWGSINGILKGGSHQRKASLNVGEEELSADKENILEVENNLQPTRETVRHLFQEGIGGQGS